MSRRPGQLARWSPIVKRILPTRAILMIAITVLTAVPAPARSPFDGEPINYSTAPVNDPVFRLQQRLDRGELQLKYDERHGYLKSVLKHLNVKASTQGLVFSKTSFQRPRISPKTPRAIYFGDDVYVGWVQGGDVVELSAVDPQLGGIFYTLRQRKSKSPKFQRRDESCMICHSSSSGQRVPGHLVQSIYPGRDGMPIAGSRRFRIDHTSPFKRRWGGWYVTGTHAAQRHLGNLLIAKGANLERLNLNRGANVIDLSDRFDTSPYLTAHSDIVALMVLEHQTQMHNVITAANYEARRALYDESQANKEAGVKSQKLSPITQLRINKAAEELLKWLLFTEEPKLAGPIVGTAGFARQFSHRGRRDPKKRSLRDFDLTTRLFKYPCSYLIHSAAFDGLPAPLRDRVYRRLWQILSGSDRSKTFSSLTAKDRLAIRQILIATKKNLPPYWTRSRPSNPTNRR